MSHPSRASAQPLGPAARVHDPQPPNSRVAEPQSSRELTAVVQGGRKGNKKTRTGCITCKIRRVKCDETKPACVRCTKTGRTCDGYAAVPSKGGSSSADRTMMESRFMNPASLKEQPLYALSAKADWTSSEQRAFHFYRACSASGLFSPVSAEFWSKVIPALCYQEPAIRHAVFAIGTLHETYFLGQQHSNLSLNSFAAAQYGKAMRQLQTWTAPNNEGFVGTVSAVLPLLSCALFICIEFMLGNAAAAHIHILQGRRLLVHYNAGDSRSPAAELVRRELVPIYTRVSVASFLLGTLPEPIPLALRWTVPGAPLIDGFKSLTEAAQAIYELLDDSYHFVQETKFWYLKVDDNGEGYSEEQVQFQSRGQELLDRLNMWEDAFAELDAPEHHRTSVVARLYFHSVRVFVGPSMERHECRYDDYAGSFASIVILAGRLLDLEDLEASTQPGSRFSFESGIMPPVYSALVKCRHPLIRRAALALLRRRAASQYTENLWDTRRVQEMGEQIMALEEAVEYESVANDMANQDASTSPVDLGGLPPDWLPDFFDDDPGIGEQQPAHVLPTELELVHRPNACLDGSPAVPAQVLADKASSNFRRWREYSDELLADMVRQSDSGALDPGSAWVQNNPVPPEYYIPEERRIRIVAVRGQDEGKSISTYFLQPGTGVILYWGVLYRDTAVKLAGC